MKRNYWVIALIIFTGLFFLAVQRVQRIRTGYEVSRLMKDIGFKESRNQYLRYLIGVYKSPNKVIAAAEAENMHIANPTEIIVLKANDEKERTKN